MRGRGRGVKGYFPFKQKPRKNSRSRKNPRSCLVEPLPHFDFNWLSFELQVSFCHKS